MKKSVLFFLIVILFAACTGKRKPVNEILLPSNLKSQVFYVDPSKDTVLRTSHSAILQIRKGSFESMSPVSIEIKEAYTPEEILLSGLTTTSDGKPLRSAGMLYINATADGSTIEPLLPIEATIPAATIDPEMQLFKGEMNEDNTINWVNPESIDTTRPEKLVEFIAAGKNLFQSNCASCHHFFSEKAGPSLKDIQNRGPWKNNLKNLLDFIHNPSEFMSKDKYTQDLKAKYGSMMNAFPSINSEGLQAMLAYINSATKDEPLSPVTARADTTKKPGELNSMDCWRYDTTYYSAIDTFPEYDTASYPDVIIDTAWNDPGFDYTSRDYTTEGYDFEIKSNGWYNVDAFLKTDSNDVQNVKLLADLKMPENVSINMNVYVFVPSERIMQSIYGRKGNAYYFDSEDGVIPLPMRYRAIIFAFGSIKDKIVYGISEFTVGKEQTIPVEIKETTKEGLKYLLQSKNINGVELEAIEKEMEVLKIPCDQFHRSDSGYTEKSDTLRRK